MAKVCAKHDEVMDYPDCGTCDGDGYLDVDDDDFSGCYLRPCFRCNGTGNSPWEECLSCSQEYFNDEE